MRRLPITTADGGPAATDHDAFARWMESRRARRIAAIDVSADGGRTVPAVSRTVRVTVRPALSIDVVMVRMPALSRTIMSETPGWRTVPPAGPALNITVPPPDRGIERMKVLVESSGSAETLA